ncbi:MAG: hypothetical protein M1826_001696 [Phylliscum demangeonii]|nr:MAG: hypothetical protein M1826_001696 [Phylliscum demangeonii]
MANHHKHTAAAAPPSAAPSAQESLTITSTDAAQDFIEAFYAALQTGPGRATLATFYLPAGRQPDGKTAPTIVLNGNTLPDPDSLRRLFEREMPAARYEVQSYDCLVLNPHFELAGAAAATTTMATTATRSVSLLVTVSGFVKYGEAREAATRGFSESFVLVREWLIQSQNFRLVV